MMKILTFIATIFLLMSCNSGVDQSNTKSKTAVDSLKDEVMDGHNKTMAKMSRLHEAQKKLQLMLDSMSRLPAEAQRNSARYKMQLDSALGRLKFADYAMDKWMNEFNMDSGTNNTETQIKYLQSEKAKIGKVKDAVFNSLQGADSLAKKKP